MAKTILASTAFALLFCGAANALAEDPAPASTAPAAPGSAPPAAPAPEKAPPEKATTDPAGTDAAAAVTDPAEKSRAWETAPSTRRAGFSVGLHLGGALGNVTGYPNDVNKRDKPEFFTDTGFAYGGGATLWLGGALTDWLVFGAGLGVMHAQGNGTVVQGMTFLFHTEVFPLFTFGGLFQDLGISLDTGAGSFTGELENKPAGEAGKHIAPVIESGAASRIGVGVFYDGIRFWKASTGPFVAFDYTWSATLQQPIVLVGFRTALYTKAPKKK